MKRSAKRLHASVLAALIGIGLAHAPVAQALVLGKVVVQPVTGEPLRAEIDVPGISHEEAASLRAGLAPLNTLRAAGMEVHPALADMQVTLLRRTDGSAFLRLTSPHPVPEKFVDLIIEVNWASGRIVRDYTLFPLPPAPVQQPTPMGQEAPPLAAAVAPLSRGDDGRVLVQSGDTAGAIALTRKPPGISLDQMLVALLQQNPEAFVAGNVNRLKAGVVLDMPSATEAGSIGAGKARQIIAAQSRDFDALRGRLARGAPRAEANRADQSAVGHVKAEMREAPAQASTADRLTLSKDGASGAKADQIASERQAQEASARVAELSRNIDALSTLGGTASPTTPSGVEAPAPATPSTVLAIESSAALPDEPPFFARLHNNPKGWLVVGLLAIAVALILYRYVHRPRHPHRHESDTQPTGPVSHSITLRPSA